MLGLGKQISINARDSFPGPQQQQLLGFWLLSCRKMSEFPNRCRRPGAVQRESLLAPVGDVPIFLLDFPGMVKTRLTFGQAEEAHGGWGSFGAADGEARVGVHPGRGSSDCSNSGADPELRKTGGGEKKIVPPIIAADTSTTGNNYILNMHNIKY